MTNIQPLPIVVLISGNGSNLQAVIDAIQNNHLSAEIRAVISNKIDAYGLERARQVHIPTEILENKNFSDRNDYDQALRKVIDHYQPSLVILAGFMRILSVDLVNHYVGRMINIHPALLPKFRGLNTHQQVLAAKEVQHGATVHFVTEELDGGPIIAQASLKIAPNDTEESLRQRVLKLEHVLYPQVIQWFAEGRLRLTAQGVQLDKRILPPEGKQLVIA